MGKEDQFKTSVRSLLERAEQNKASLEAHFAQTGVRVKGFNDLLRYLDAAVEIATTEEPLRLLGFFVARARTDVQMAVVASYFGLLSVTADVMRDLMEIALLLREFIHDVSAMEHWFQISERDRQREFGPNRLRQLYADRIGMPVENLPDSRDYRAHSMTLHVGPRQTVFRRGLVSSPDVLTETDVGFAEIFGHTRQVTTLSYELARILNRTTAMPDPASATEFQNAADNAQEFTLPILIATLESVRDARKVRTETQEESDQTR